jgi:hypothetical protein
MTLDASDGKLLPVTVRVGQVRDRSIQSPALIVSDLVLLLPGGGCRGSGWQAQDHYGLPDPHDPGLNVGGREGRAGNGKIPPLDACARGRGPSEAESRLYGGRQVDGVNWLRALTLWQHEATGRQPVVMRAQDASLSRQDDFEPSLFLGLHSLSKYLSNFSLLCIALNSLSFSLLARI